MKQKDQQILFKIPPCNWCINKLLNTNASVSSRVSDNDVCIFESKWGSPDVIKNNFWLAGSKFPLAKSKKLKACLILKLLQFWCQGNSTDFNGVTSDSGWIRPIELSLIKNLLSNIFERNCQDKFMEVTFYNNSKMEFAGCVAWVWIRQHDCLIPNILP